QENFKALIEQIQKARKISPGGVLGVNVMVAINDFAETVRAAIEAGIDIIFSGAGLPLQLPAIAQGSRVKLVPIVSSARAAALMCKHWGRKHHRYPDAVVLEGPEAGGHLGFSEEELEQAEDFALEKLVPETVAAVKSFESKAGRPIPVIAAGGLWTGEDMSRMLKLGAAGVQMATKFVPTHECDASAEFKQAYLDADKEDIVLIKSPVGMAGRAIRNGFLSAVEAGERKPIRCAYNCLRPCDPKTAPYCIAAALIHAQRGELDRGFAFAGINAWRATELRTVPAIFNELKKQLLAAP
ncbi:MAG TPA: nitronate monooxygenase family protein, partial [bacterium]|nr:nitronate monooxygenase family protein [bacterium]